MECVLGGWLHRVYAGFLAVYFANLILNFCSLYVAYSPAVLRDTVGLLVMVTGSVLLTINAVRAYRKELLIPRCAYYLMGLLVLMGVSGAVNGYVGLVENVKIVVWSAILFFVVLPFFQSEDKRSIFRDFTIIVLPGLILWGLMVLVSLVTFYLNVQECELWVQDYLRPRFVGVHNNRLFGVFVDASMGSILCWCMTVVSLVLAVRTRSKFARVLLSLLMFCAIQVISASGARSSVVVIIISSTAFVWLVVRRRMTGRMKKWGCFDLLILALSFVGCLLLTLICVQLVREAMVAIARCLNADSAGSMLMSLFSLEGSSDGVSVADGSTGSISLERTDLKGKDVTNLRADLWAGAFQAFLDKPLFGTSLGGFIPYMREVYPSSFAALGYDVGNGYLAVLVYGGIFAAIVMAFFIASQLIFFAKWLKGRQREEDPGLGECALFSLLVSVGVSAGINMDIFYINCATTFLFWLVLGALRALCSNVEVHQGCEGGLKQ